MSKPRKLAVKGLRIARDLVERGWIRKGRETIHYMATDCIDRGHEEAMRTAEGTVSYLHGDSARVSTLMYSAACKHVWRGTVPGTRRERMRYVAQWQHQQLTQDTIHRMLRSAVESAVLDERAYRTGGKA